MRPLTLLLLAALPASAGTIVTLVGTGKAGYSGDRGPAAEAQLNQPFHVHLDGKGGLLVAEAFNHCVRRIDLATGRITTVAGTGKKGYPETAARRPRRPSRALCGRHLPEGDLFIADRLNACVRRVDGKTGVVTTVAGTSRSGLPGDGGPGAALQSRRAERTASSTGPVAC
ncbi:MAG: hypothetical protein U0797_04495 [Gemmataceae bacterium]